jgi:hypothetical protein
MRLRGEDAMTVAAMTLRPIEPRVEHPGLSTGLQIVTVLACLALFAAFAKGLWIAPYPPARVIVCTDTPEACR